VSARSPWEVLGVAESTGLSEVAVAFARRAAELGPPLVSAHAEDRPAAIADWAELVAAFRAIADAGA
jgi:hypothetical protein